MKLRRWCKRLLLGAVSAGGSMIIAACYGPVDDGYAGAGWELVSGRVVDREAGSGIQGLQVCATFYEAESVCTTSGSNGYFLIEADQQVYEEAERDGLLLKIEDVDGDDNGRYSPEEQQVPPPMPASVTVSVDPAAD